VKETELIHSTLQIWEMGDVPLPLSSSIPHLSPPYLFFSLCIKQKDTYFVFFTCNSQLAAPLSFLAFKAHLPSSLSSHFSFFLFIENKTISFNNIKNK